MTAKPELSGTPRHVGAGGEVFAREYLETRGFRIIAMNYRFHRGEIDIIAWDGPVLVFCEVKTRESREFGPPEYALTPAKQQQIRRVAEGFLYEHGLSSQECRFDVLTILLEGGQPVLSYLRNAFQ